MYTKSRKLILASAITLALASISGSTFADTMHDDATKSHGAMMSQDVINARQESQIWTTFSLSPYLRENDLKVSVNDGTATLTGTVDENVNKQLAKQIAMGVIGIKDVDTQIDHLKTSTFQHNIA